MLLNRGANAFGTPPVASGDFTNIATNNAADGVYTLNGETVAITDIIDTAHPGTVFDPVADIDAGGILRHDDGDGGFSATVLHLKDPLKAQLIANGFTVVIEYFCPTTAAFGLAVEMAAADSGVSVNPYSVADIGYIECWSYDNGSDLYIDTEFSTQNAINKFAVTWTGAKQSMCLNGGDVHSQAAPGIGVLLENMWFAMPGTDADMRIRSFAFYEPVEDADLVTLSA